VYSKPKGIIFLSELVVHGIGVQEYRTSRLLVLAYYDNPMKGNTILDHQLENQTKLTPNQLGYLNQRKIS
jgi:hypothetical protein